MDKKSNENRRKLLKSIAAGSGAVIAGKSLPEKWSRPIVDSVVIPAHALTSPVVYAANLSLLMQAASETMMAADKSGLLDSLVPNANAGGTTIILPTDYLCISVLGGVFDGRFSRSYSPGEINEYANSGGTLGNGLPLPFIAGCDNAITPTLTVSNPTPTGVDFILDFGKSQITGTLPPGDCSIVPAGICLGPSDRNIKENFSSVDEQEILRKVASLPIEMWNYSDREQGVRHIGPMAQDFMASFNVGDSDRHINMVDANGVNLAAIKALNARLEEKDTQINHLQEQLAEVMSRLEKLA